MAVPLALGSELALEQALAIQGELFSFTLDTLLAAGASYKIGFTSPRSLTFLHSRWRSGAPRCRVYIYESLAYTGGTIRPLGNRNRRINKPAETVMHYGVTATTVPANATFFGYFGDNAGGTLEIDEPIIFAENTPYVIEMLNDANSQQDVISFHVACCEYDID